MTDKAAIRKFIREQKAALDAQLIADYSAAVAERIAALPAYRNAPVLYAYLAYNQELRTDALIRRAWANGKRVAVPKVLAPGEMEFYTIESLDDVAPGYCGIPEPPGPPAPPADDGEILMLMPGLAYDRAHHRIGYGGGFYDRYIARRQAQGARILTVAPAYTFQILDAIPAEAHDLPADVIVTADELLRRP